MLTKVTVLICNYNYGYFISDAIQSCLDQTYSPLHICVIDDGSTDNSNDIILNKLSLNNSTTLQKLNPSNDIEIVTDLVGKNRHTLVQLKSNHGPSYARNVGIDVSMSETDAYIILDADDIMAPNKIEVLLDKLNQSNHIGVVYADYDILNCDTGNVIREYKYRYSLNQLKQDCIVHSQAMIRSQALKDVCDTYGYYNCLQRVAEDYQLWTRIAHKYVICHVPQSLTLVRNHRGNSSYTVPKEIWHHCWNMVKAAQ